MFCAGKIEGSKSWNFPTDFGGIHLEFVEKFLQWHDVVILKTKGQSETAKLTMEGEKNLKSSRCNEKFEIKTTEGEGKFENFYHVDFLP